MRSLNRNRRLIHYALRTGEVENIDEYGNETSELTPAYGAVTPLSCNISSGMGEDTVRAFGNFTSYSRTICVADTNCPIDVGSVVWFGIEPTEPHNYIVVQKADSKNGLVYALREVSVT